MSRPFFALGPYRSRASFSAGASLGWGGAQVEGAAPGRLLFYPPVDTTTQGDDDHARMSAVPAGWGDGEATLAMKVRLSTAMLTGTAVNRWSTDNTAIYSDPGGGNLFWYLTNFLVDWFNNDTFSAGSFGIGFRNSGRPIVLLGDGAPAAARVGEVHAVYSASAASWLDDEEHELAVVFRNTTPGNSRRIELWGDYELIASETSSARTSMYTTYWAGLGLNDLVLGAEKISALGGTPWFKHAGGLRFMRFWTRARSTDELSDPAQDDSATGRVARFSMPEPDINNEVAEDEDNGSIEVFPQSEPAWEAV